MSIRRPGMRRHPDWDRATIEACLSELKAIDQILIDNGFEHPLGARGVHDMGIVLLGLREEDADETPEPGGPEVHVDWRMTPAEWNELRNLLTLHRNTSQYVTRLHEAGKLNAINTGKRN